MKKENLYLLILISVEIVVLILIAWFATHSEYVTHAEFLVGMIGLFTAISTGFWTLWNRISLMSEKIGYLNGKSKKE